jgi:hypothetical protein
MSGKLKTHMRALLGGLLIITAVAPAAISAEISGGVVRIGVVNDQTGFLSDPTGQVFHSSAETDYTSYLLQAQASGADTIGFASTGSQLVTEMKQWTEFGMTGGPQKPGASS